MTASRASVSTVVIAALLDLVLVLVFVTIGRQSHHESITLAGTAETAWPFIVGLIFAWLVTRFWLHPLGVLLPGVLIWVITLVLAMLLRLVSGQSIQLPFVIVATVVLALFLLGWRALAAGFRRIRRSPEAP